MNKPLLEFNEKGIYCSLADIYIDAWKQYKQPCRFLPLDGPNQLTNIYPEDWNGNLHPK